MNIVFFVNTWPSGSTPNGIVTYASYIIPALRELGHTVYVLTHNKIGNDEYTYEIFKLPLKYKILTRLINVFSPNMASYFASTKRINITLAKIIKDRSIDIIEMEESFGWCAEVSKLGLVSVVVRLHGPWFLTGPADNQPMEMTVHKRRIEREGIGIAMAAGISAPSEFVLKESANYYHQQNPIASVIANPIQTHSEKVRWSADKANWRRIVFVGRFDQLKGADLVLQAFSILAKEIPHLELDFVGPDIGLRQGDGTLLGFNEYLEEFVDTKARRHINYHGMLDREEIDHVRINGCVTIVASRVEMFGYTVLEALSLGCPVVATAVGGIPELIIDGKTGLLVQKSEPESIAHSCRLLLSDRKLAARVGKAAAAHAEQNYGSLSVARRTAEFYGRVMKSKC